MNFDDDVKTALLAELHDAIAEGDGLLTELVDDYRAAVAEDDVAGLLRLIRHLDKADPDSLRTFTLAAVRRLAAQAAPSTTGGAR